MAVGTGGLRRVEAARRRRRGCQTGVRTCRFRGDRRGLVAEDPGPDAGAHPLTPTDPKLNGPTVERTSINTTERSATRWNRRASKRSVRPWVGASTLSATPGSLKVGRRRLGTIGGRSRRRGHRRPAGPQRSRPPTSISASTASAVPVAWYRRRTRPRQACSSFTTPIHTRRTRSPQRGHPVDPPGRAGGGVLGRRLHQTVGLELGQGP